MGKYGLRNNSARFKTTKTDKIVIDNKIPVVYTVHIQAVGTATLMANKDWNALGTAAQGKDILLIQPPYPVRLTLTGNVAGTALDGDEITFAGVDAQGNSISEALTVLSAANLTSTTSRAFAEITSMTANQVVKSTGVAIGIGSGAGLPWPITSTTDIISYAYNGIQGTTTQVASVSVSTTYDVLSLPTVGADSLTVIYKTKLQESTTKS